VAQLLGADDGWHGEDSYRRDARRPALDSLHAPRYPRLLRPPALTYSIRLATAADVSALARHRAEMFRDMGQLSDDLYDTLVEASRAYFTQAIADGRYVAWVAESRTAPGQIVGRAGTKLPERLQRPGGTGERLLRGPEGLVVNVF